jgi:transcriptional regulator with XRE-family HTH domain
MCRLTFNFLFMNEKTEFAERLRQAMANAGYEPRPAVLEKGFNSRYWGRSVSFQAVSRWLHGEAIPSQEKLQVLADWLGVEPHVLRFGERVSLSVQERRQRWDNGIGYLEREVFEAFLSLPTHQRKVLREVILTFAKAHREEDGGEKEPK